MEHKKTISNNNNNNNYVVNIISTNDNTNVINTISSNDDNNNNNNNDNNNIVVLWPIRKTVFVFKKNFSFLDQVQKCFFPVRCQNNKYSSTSYNDEETI